MNYRIIKNQRAIFPEKDDRTGHALDGRDTEPASSSYFDPEISGNSMINNFSQIL